MGKHDAQRRSLHFQHVGNNLANPSDEAASLLEARIARQFPLENTALGEPENNSCSDASFIFKPLTKIWRM